MQELQTQEDHLNESPKKKVKENHSALLSLRESTIVVADSGRYQEIQQYKPQDSTTNPSLILEVVKLEEYQVIVDRAIQKGIADYQKGKITHALPVKRIPKKKTKGDVEEEKIQEEKENDKKEEEFSYKVLDDVQKKLVLSHICDQMCVNFGIEILKLVPGYVSTEVDARLSYDKQASINKAKQLISLYEQAGVSRDRILIKLASTWEGIETAKALKKEKIQCNMTLIFNYHQAIACAQAQVQLISPFVGRILDWFKKNRPDEDHTAQNDPGVKLVTRVWQYFRKNKHNTIVMAASFRTLEEIEYLSGCDRMTIPLNLLDQLQNTQDKTLTRRLNQELVDSFSEEKVTVDEKLFRWSTSIDPMANELLAHGIKRFADDIEKLEKIIEQKLLI